MRSLLLFATVLAAVLSASPAGATVGGPATLDILGYDQTGHKVYVIETFHDEGERPPQLHYLLVDGAHAGTTVEVRSWYRRGAPDIDTRLAVLKTRLKPMTPVAPSGFTVSSQLVHSFVERNSAGDEWPGWLVHATVRENTAASGGTAELRLFLRRDVSVAACALVPERPLAVAILRYVGIPYELGYELDKAVLVPTARQTR